MECPQPRDRFRDGPPRGIPGYGLDGRDDEGRTHTQVWAKEASAFIRGTEGKPFFAYVAPLAPHGPFAYPEEYEELFRGARAPRLPSFNEEDVSDKPGWVKSSAPFNEQNISKMDEQYRDMARSVKDVDDMVGTIVEALWETGELGNTYIVFTSDNG
jgi:N-acetylglucosamine-6-sulfatase